MKILIRKILHYAYHFSMFAFGWSPFLSRWIRRIYFIANSFLY